MGDKGPPAEPASRLRNDVGWLWGGYLARTLGYAGLVVVLTRSLGPVGFGELSLFLALTLGVSQLAGSWPFLAVPVLNARGATIGGAFHSAAVVASAATFACLLVAIPMTMLILSPSPWLIAALVVYSAALVALQGVYGVLQALSRMRDLAGVQAMERVTGFLAVLVAVFVAPLTVESSATLLAVAALGTSIAALLVVLPPDSRRSGVTEGPRRLVPIVFRAVGPLGIVSVCAYGVAWIDIYVLDFFSSRSEVGVYSLAYQVFTFVAQLGSLWAVATLPRHARSAAGGKEIAKQVPEKRLLVACKFWAALVVLVGVSSVLALPHVFGSDFDEAAVPVAVLMAGAVFLAGYFAVLPAFIAGGRTRQLVWVSVASVAINVVLDVALVPLIGTAGPALATFAQTLFGAAALLLLALGKRIAQKALLCGLPAAGALGVLALAPHSTAAIAGCLAVALVTGVWGMRERPFGESSET